MRTGRGAIWAALALLGIVLAAGLTLSVMRLAGEHIGLASAPISVVRGLAPTAGAGGTPKPDRDARGTVTRTVTVSRTVTEIRSASGAVTAPAVGATGGTSGVTGAGSQLTPVTPRIKTTTSTSAVTIRPPSGRSSGGSDDGRQDSRAGSGGGPDD